MKELIIPHFVRKEGKVALIGPATRIKPEIVEAFIRLYDEHPEEMPGGELIVYPSALDANACGSYAASAQQRVADFKDAWGRDDIDLVICARGGYGCVHLLDYLPVDFIKAHTKWLVGFSDVSALHALLHKCGIASIHGGMAKQLVEDTDSGYDCYRRTFKSLVEGAWPALAYRVAAHPYNIPGEGRGVLLGGNLAVLSGLAATPFDMMAAALTEDVILFIEDVSEPIYAVERMLYRLHLQGVLRSVKGILVGQFTDWKSDRNHESMYDMIHERFQEWGIGCPVVFDFPVGHNEHNVPLIEGAEATLQVDGNGACLAMRTRTKEIKDF
ncbi:MAG: LD-carboxypeptidase [Muribaculaceae bacterium]|nr:LD-carboxypeptidase [Muribaculaceae bacterium]